MYKFKTGVKPQYYKYQWEMDGKNILSAHHPAAWKCKLTEQWLNCNQHFPISVLLMVDLAFGKCSWSVYIINWNDEIEVIKSEAAGVRQAMHLAELIGEQKMLELFPNSVRKVLDSVRVEGFTKQNISTINSTSDGLLRGVPFGFILSYLGLDN